MGHQLYKLFEVATTLTGPVCRRRMIAAWPLRDRQRLFVSTGLTEHHVTMLVHVGISLHPEVGVCRDFVMA